MRNDSDLDMPLLHFRGGGGYRQWTMRHSFEGLAIFGGIGSGKSSGSGRLFATKFLQAGYGGLVLTAKNDEKDIWLDYARSANRAQDVIILEPDGSHYFNFLHYESQKKLNGRPITENLVQVLKTVIRASQEKSGGKSEDPFWESALDMLIFNTIDLCLLAYDVVTVQEMYDIVMSIPRKDMPKGSSGNSAFINAMQAAQLRVDQQMFRYVDDLPPEEKQRLKNIRIFDKEMQERFPDAKLFRHIEQFFMFTYRTLAEKTRSIIEFSFSGFLFRLLKEPIYSMFCEYPSTFSPEDCLQGKIIILNIPAKNYDKVGRDAQIMFKYIWQRAMEKRKIKDNGRPVFLWADEAQHFLHEHDSVYQATARSSRIATVYISQNLANYYANMGSDRYEYRVKSLLGTLSTKVFHCNSDFETNDYASTLIGDGYTEDYSVSNTVAGEFSSSHSKSYELERMVRPEEFSSLKTGGPMNGFMVEAYVHVQGSPFQDGMNHRKITFQQH